MANFDPAIKNRTRRAAARQGYRVCASRQRDPNGLRYGRVELVDLATDRVVHAAGYSWADIESWLRTPVAERPTATDRLLKMLGHG